MAETSQARPSHPAKWVPTMYFAEGLPYFAVSLMAAIFYKKMGIPNDVIARDVSALLLPWSLKPLWSPLLEMYKTKKFFVVLLEFLGGASFVLVALCLPLSGYLTYTLVLFAVIAVCSSTHDIAADGLYIASLSPKEQAEYSGWQGGFYNVARFFAQGGLIIIAGFMEIRMHAVARAWMGIFAGLGVILVLLSFYHSRVLPPGGEERHSENFRQVAATFWDVVVTFFKKRSILLLLVFIFLYRAGEGQVTRIGPLFLVDSRTVGGLGLTTKQFGMIYGTFGTVAFIFGSVLGGYFISVLGLKRALTPLIVVMNLPMLAYFYLSSSLPSSSALITLAMSAEMFGYGFGFVGVIVLMMQEIAPGKYKTAHYAFATALMNFGVMVPGWLSGKIQMAIGYQRFFIWALISVIPALVLSRFVPIRGGAQIPDSELAAEAGAK